MKKKQDEMSGMKEWERKVKMGAREKVTRFSSVTPLHIKIPFTVATTPVAPFLKPQLRVHVANVWFKYSQD